MSLDNTEETAEETAEEPRQQHDGAPSASGALPQQHSNPMPPWYYAFSQVTGAYLPYTYYWHQMQQLHSARGMLPMAPPGPATYQLRPAPPQAGQAQMHPHQHARPPTESIPEKPSGDNVGAGGIVSSEDEGSNDDTSGKSIKAGANVDSNEATGLGEVSKTRAAADADEIAIPERRHDVAVADLITNGFSFEDLCNKINNHKYIAVKGGWDHKGSEVLMTHHLQAFMARESSCLGSCRDEKEKSRRFLMKNMRPVDACEIPQLQIDEGIIRDWNRSLVDLTGIKREEVVGNSYADMLDQWLPNLSREYKKAAVEWLAADDVESCYNCMEIRRVDYLFPLALPVRSEPRVYAYSRYKDYGDEYVELLVARTHRLQDIYPQWDRRDIDQYDKTKKSWKYDTTGWIGGAEYTLRRKQIVPSLQQLCKDILPSGVVDDNGMLVPHEVVAAASEEEAQDKDSTDSNTDKFQRITDFARSCDSVGFKYIREVLWNVRHGHVFSKVNNKIYSFTQDWSSNPVTEEVHRLIFSVLGGAELIKQTVEKGKLAWRLAFKPGKPGMDRSLRRELDKKKEDWGTKWRVFRSNVLPVVQENPLSRPMCLASNSPLHYPSIDDPRRTLLTLKIDGHECRNGYGDDLEPFQLSATIQVPASLNFFQLHRVVNQTVNASSDCEHQTHKWSFVNLAYEWHFSSGSTLTNERCQLVELGTTYDQSWSRERRSGYTFGSLFEQGRAIRQRISKTGAYNQKVRFECGRHDGYYGGYLDEETGEDKIHACIHSTCISALFTNPGITALLQQGHKHEECQTNYKVTCSKVESYVGPMPQNPKINVMLSKCLRGTPQDPEMWSAKEANEQLFKDRGCLRRMLLDFDSETCMQVMPWCHEDHSDYVLLLRDRREKKPPRPLATELVGPGQRSLHLLGEPPLPGSDKFKSYVKSLDGLIDPDFDQDDVCKHGSFDVPFRNGTHYRNYWDCDDVVIGESWQADADNEQGRIDALMPNKKPCARKKRKPKKKSDEGEQASVNKRAKPT